MKTHKLKTAVLAALSFALLIVSASASAQRGGHAGYHFGGGAHFGGGYYAPRSSYHYTSPGFGATHDIYHPRYAFVPFKGVNYGYYNGLFYLPSAFGLHFIFPPVGITVGVLPYGYYPFYWGLDPYFYYGGIFYQPYYDGGYQVVTPPIGSLVPQLPAGATTQVINGQEYFEYYGTFYKKEVHQNGEVWYKVVGVNGKLKTAQGAYNQPAQPAAVQNGQQPTTPIAGDLLYKLPDGSKAVTINGEQYFQSPDGNYYQQVSGEDNKVLYQMLDKSTIQQQAPAPGK